MVKPLVFKGEKRPKKRKAPNTAVLDASSAAAAHQIDSENLTSSIEDDSWVSAEVPSDILGPVLLILPSVPPTCLACDQNGKVYASEIENIIEGEVATAEPHDKRQVWVATRVAGTEKVSFKGHHGRYLSCDKFGVLSALPEAISAEESFLCVVSPDVPGSFSMQSEYAMYITVKKEIKGPEIRGDSEAMSSDTVVHVRMQARFKPKLKASKDSKAQEKISRKQLEEAVGRKLEDDEVRKLKKARIEGDYHEAVLDVRVKGKHDKYA